MHSPYKPKPPPITNPNSIPPNLLGKEYSWWSETHLRVLLYKSKSSTPQFSRALGLVV